MRCKHCITHPKLIQSGWSDPAYRCPVCGQLYWVRDGNYYYEKPEDHGKKGRVPPDP